MLVKIIFRENSMNSFVRMKREFSEIDFARNFANLEL